MSSALIGQPSPLLVTSSRYAPVVTLFALWSLYYRQSPFELGCVLDRTVTVFLSGKSQGEVTPLRVYSGLILLLVCDRSGQWLQSKLLRAPSPPPVKREEARQTERVECPDPLESAEMRPPIVPPNPPPEDKQVVLQESPALPPRFSLSITLSDPTYAWPAIPYSQLHLGTIKALDAEQRREFKELVSKKIPLSRIESERALLNELAIDVDALRSEREARQRPRRSIVRLWRLLWT